MKNILILDTGNEWGGGTNSLLEFLKRADKDRYAFTALFYRNYEKGSESDMRTEMEKLDIAFVLFERKRQPTPAKVLKNLIRSLFFWNKRLANRFVFFVDYHFRIRPNAQEIARNLRDMKIDLIYMNNQPSSNLEGILAAGESGTLALQHCRKEAALNSFEVAAVNKWLPKIICVSKSIRQSLIDQGVEAEKCSVVYNGIDSGVIPETVPSKIRKQWRIADDEILVGTVGSLNKGKRVKDLVEAMSIVALGTVKPIKCIVVGEGREKGHLIEMGCRNSLGDKIIFTGFLSDAISHTNAMDIFVLPSEKEGLPRVILEAMLMGKPVIACDVPGSSELVVHGKTGILVPVGSPDSLAAALLTLIEDSDLRERMGAEGKKRVVSNFTIGNYVKGVEQILDEILVCDDARDKENELSDSPLKAR